MVLLLYFSFRHVYSCPQSPRTNHNHNDHNDDHNHPNIEPSRFLLMDWEVRGNLEIGKNYLLKNLERNYVCVLVVLLVAWLLGFIAGQTILLLWPLKTLKSSHFSGEETDDADNVDGANDTDDTYDTDNTDDTDDTDVTDYIHDMEDTEDTELGWNRLEQVRFGWNIL